MNKLSHLLRQWYVLNILIYVASSLKCYECTSGNCLTSTSSFGIEKTCGGSDPVCVKQISRKRVIRTCENSNTYAPLRPLAGQCLEYKGKTTCYCTGDKCNSGHEITPILFAIFMPFLLAIVLL